jgi:hypothetical protein
MFDPTGRMAGQMPMTSYAGNNALGGLAAANYGQMPMRPQGGEFMKRGMMNPQMGQPTAPQAPPGLPDPAGMQPQWQSALAGMGQPGPLTFNPQGLPQQFQDFRQQLQDWRGLRPDRPDWQAMRGTEGFDPRQARADWRGQMQDWRGQRPQFAGWR